MGIGRVSAHVLSSHSSRLSPPPALLFLGALTLVCALTACSDRTPESEAAKELGKQPKQTLDNVQNKLDSAAATGTARMQDADNKISAPGDAGSTQDAAKAP